MKKRLTGTLFPNANPLAGFYSPTSFCITLNQITGRQLAEMGKDKSSFIEKRKILHHEVRHHIDHLSTLWGHQRILALHEAVDARLDKDEYNYYKIAAYKRAENQLHYYKYYTTNQGLASYNVPEDRWKARISSGVRFSANGEPCADKPILFISFESPDKKASMRVPMTVASLLEVNAIYEETAVEEVAINRVDEKNRSKAKQAWVNKLIRNVVYHQAMMEYNCSVHLVANSFNISDPYEAFTLASSVATVALNLPHEVLTTIPIDKEYLDVWGKRPEDFINDNNYGFIFFNMVSNYKEIYRSKRALNLAEFLEANHLPGKTNLEAMILSKMQQHIDAINSDSYFSDFFKQHLKAGITLFQRRGLDGKTELLQDTLYSGKYSPFLVTKDSAFPVRSSFNDFFARADKPRDIDITDWYHLSTQINERMEEFYQICGI
jgi:hypothetical protein